MHLFLPLPFARYKASSARLRVSAGSVFRSCSVSIGIVDSFEQINVDHANAKGGTVAGAAMAFLGDSFHQVAPVVNAGQFITDGHIADALQGRLEFDIAAGQLFVLSTDVSTQRVDDARKDTELPDRHSAPTAVVRAQG